VILLVVEEAKFASVAEVVVHQEVTEN